MIFILLPILNLSILLLFQQLDAKNACNNCHKAPFPSIPYLQYNGPSNSANIYKDSSPITATAIDSTPVCTPIMGHQGVLVCQTHVALETHFTATDDPFYMMALGRCPFIGSPWIIDSLNQFGCVAYADPGPEGSNYCDGSPNNIPVCRYMGLNDFYGKYVGSVVNGGHDNTPSAQIIDSLATPLTICANWTTYSAYGTVYTLELSREVCVQNDEERVNQFGPAYFLNFYNSPVEGPDVQADLSNLYVNGIAGMYYAPSVGSCYTERLTKQTVLDETAVCYYLVPKQFMIEILGNMPG